MAQPKAHFKKGQIALKGQALKLLKTGLQFWPNLVLELDQDKKKPQKCTHSHTTPVLQIQSTPLKLYAPLRNLCSLSLMLCKKSNKKIKSTWMALPKGKTKIHQGFKSGPWSCVRMIYLCIRDRVVQHQPHRFVSNQKLKNKKNRNRRWTGC